MLTTEHSLPFTKTASSSPTRYQLRLHGGTEDERLLPIPWGKYSVGSGPRCSLRLKFDGVQPLECLIVHDESGLRIRRWSDTTRVNGQPFDDVRLAPGDKITVGTLELEVVAAEQEEEFAADSREAADNAWQSDRGEVAWQPVDAYRNGRPYSAGPTTGAASTTSSRRDEFERRAASIARRRSRRILAELRRQRQEHDQLMGRVDDLVRNVEHALTERPSDAEQIGGRLTERVPVADATPESARAAQSLATELEAVRGQLSARDAELAQARYSIDALERQLIDSQHTLHAFVEERVSWESQFNELESRLAEYVGRIQDLEQELNRARAAKAEAESAPPAPISQHPDEMPVAEPVSPERVEAPTVAIAEVPPSTENPQEDATVDMTVSETASDAASDMAAETVTDTGDTLVVGESPRDEEAEVDAALEHLRGLSIWREEPEPEAETAGQASIARCDRSEWPEEVIESGSFIDRYAHLFPPEDAAQEPPAMPNPPAPPAPAAESRADAENNVPTSTHAEEESVEQYMARLLERMRGTPSRPVVADESAANAPPQEPPAAVEEKAVADDWRTKSGPDYRHRGTSVQSVRTGANQRHRGDAGVGEPIGAARDRLAYRSEASPQRADANGHCAIGDGGRYLPAARRARLEEPAIRGRMRGGDHRDLLGKADFFDAD